jgi:hypothetical protein
MTISLLPRRRLVALVLTLLLMLVPSLGAVADAGAAADWIAVELDADEPSFDLFGRAAARADVVFALASAGTREGSARQALDELAAEASGYVGPADSANPGALAKVLLAVLVSRHDPTSFLPGRDLEAELRALERADGSFADDVFSHSLAMIALGAATDGVPAAAVAWLLDRQNADGSWSFQPPSPDVDVTALALQALLAAGADEGVADAVAFLTGAQNPNGSWTDAFGLENANTAGLAGQALRAAGETDAADRAADFILGLQTGDGGVRFTAADDDPNGYATLQGLLALGGAAYHELEVDPFADVGWEHLFAVEIDWLGDSGVTRGCDPPDNDSYCPHDPITRGQMAAMLHRALGDALPAGQPVDYTDTAGTVFGDDIEWLSATGITRGCNPPDNDRFCPDDPVSRGQMAAMLNRALAD